MANPYQLYTEDELVLLVATLKTRKLSILSGTEYQSGSMGGKSYTRAILELKELDKQLELIAEILFALNPDEYPLLQTPDRTTADFGSWRFL